MKVQSPISMFFLVVLLFHPLMAQQTEPTTVNVFVPKEDGYPAIRIPSIVCTNPGTLLAFAEGRQSGDHSKNDIILKRSEDDGQTWNKVQLIHDAGERSLNNPQAVVLDSGRILLMYQENRLGERLSLIHI